MDVLQRLLNILYTKFGGYINYKGYRVLDQHVRIIQGDGVNLHSIKEIVDLVERIGFSADNIIYGSGGALKKNFHSIRFDDFQSNF